MAGAAELARANATRIDLVELRADFLQDGELAHLGRFPRMIGMPAILTIRRTSEGGQYRGDEVSRRRLIGTSVEGYHYVDLESDVDRSFDELVPAGTRVIRSLHDTAGVPKGLERVIRELARAPAEIAKAAVTPQSGREMVDLIAVAQRLAKAPSGAHHEQIVLGMGRFGVPASWQHT